MQATIVAAKKTLNRYYSLTDSSDLYQIAMGNIITLFSGLCDSDIFCKFFTLVTSSLISRLQDGPMNGLRWLEVLFPNGLPRNTPPVSPLVEMESWTQILSQE